jgi:hypothetical protein
MLKVLFSISRSEAGSPSGDGYPVFAATDIPHRKILAGQTINQSF